MQFLTPLAFLGALLAVPIILLYMLRLRRREMLVSSTFLWQQILQDQEANTPWQRLRRNLLLLLQLLILALLVLALARPFITVPSVSAAQTALLLDASASMNATDTTSGRTRFEEARLRALEIVDTLSDGSIMTIIRVGTSPEILTPYTGDRERLRGVINDAQPGTGRGDWLTALTLAAEGGRGVEDFSVVILGDGGLNEGDNLPSISIPGDVRFIPVGTSDQNIAITALASRAVPGQTPQLFAQLTNYGATDAEVVFSLQVDDNPVPLVSERYTVPAESNLPIVSTAALTQNFSTLHANLTLSVNSVSQDYLAEDNDAWYVARQTGERTALLMTAGNLFLEQVLRSQPGLQLFRGDINRPLPQQPYDLYIFDAYLPPTLPDADMLIVNPPASTDLFTVGAEQTGVNKIEVVQGDDRLAFVDFSSVNVLKFRQVDAPGWASALITADGLPLLLAGENSGRQIGLFTFNLRDSDLPLQITFPVLMANLLEWFTPGDVLVSTGTLNVGDAVIIRPPLDADTVRVTAPNGTVTDLPLERQTVVYNDATQPGIYRLDVLAGETISRTQSFAVNLFSPDDSDIAPRQVTIGGVPVTGDAREEPGQREFWWAAALIALAVLLIEWLIYHRQRQIPAVAVRSRPRPVATSR